MQGWDPFVHLLWVRPSPSWSGTPDRAVMAGYLPPASASPSTMEFAVQNECWTWQSPHGPVARLDFVGVDERLREVVLSAGTWRDLPVHLGVRVDHVPTFVKVAPGPWPGGSEAALVLAPCAPVAVWARGRVRALERGSAFSGRLVRRVDVRCFREMLQDDCGSCWAGDAPLSRAAVDFGGHVGGDLA